MIAGPASESGAVTRRGRQALRLAYLAHADESGPSSRYRIYQYREIFAARQVELDILPAFSSAYMTAESHFGFERWRRRSQAALSAAWRRVGQLARLRTARVSNGGLVGVIIERELYPRLPEVFEQRLLRMLGGLPYALEFDDAMYLSPGRREKYPHLLEGAAGVVVGNETLAIYARQFNDRVLVVPTTLQLRRYPAKSVVAPRPAPRGGAKLRIGWLGLPYNFPHLRAIAPALAEVCQRFAAELVVISARPPDGLAQLGVPVAFVPWSEEREVEQLRCLDIGIMPLDDTPFAAGKCGLKLLQYMAVGLPVVASPVGVNRQIIADGVQGYLASTVEQWRDALVALLDSAERRLGMGALGRQRVAEGYEHEVWGHRLVDFYGEVFGGGS